MPDNLKKVKSGDALVIPAQTFNTFIDAARDFRSRQQGRAQTAQQTGCCFGRSRSNPTKQCPTGKWRKQAPKHTTG